MMAGPRSRPSGNQPLVMDRERRGSTRMNAIGHALGVFVAIGMVALLPMGAAAQDTDSPSPTASAPAQPAFTLVGLGDSVPGALECPPGCRSYVRVYGELASQALQAPVSVRNLATNDSLDSARLLSRVLHDHPYREALAGADLITLTIGNNDDPSGVWTCPGDDACSAAARAQTEQNIAAILREIASLRAGRPTAIRVTGYYDMAIGDPGVPPQDQPLLARQLAAFNAMICEVAEANGALCVDLVPAFNGPDGTADAGDLLVDDHIHPSKAGQELIAAAVDATGYAPLHPVGVPAGPTASVAPGAGSPSPAAPMVLVSGVFVPGPGDLGFEETSVVEGNVRQRGRDSTGHMDMSDPRLSGDVAVRDNADRWCGDPCNGPLADILWGTIEIANDGGTWAGTSVGTSDVSADGTGIGYYELVGAGAYEGLSAVLFQTETYDPATDSSRYFFKGVIIPGDLPPER